MTERDGRLSELRRRAEAATSRKDDLEKMTAEEAGDLLHELDVYQTELEMQNEELRESASMLEVSAARFRELYEFAPVGYVTLDRNGWVLESNLAASAILGVSRQELVGTRLVHLLMPQDREAYHGHLRNVFGARSREVMEAALMQSSGLIWIELHSVPMEREVETVCLTTILDVTERKQAREERERERRSFVRLAENSPDIICRCDREGRFIYVSPAIARMTSFAPEDMKGKTLEDSGLPREVCDKWREAFKLAEESGQAQEVECELPVDGHARCFAVLVTPEQDENGRLQSFMGIARDITERARIEDELRRARQKAEDANRAKSEFLATMSHEIRTPLNGVLGMLQLLGISELNDKQRKYVEVATESGYGLLEIINDILDLAKIEAGRLEVEHEVFNPRRVVAAATDIFTREAQRKGIELALDVNETVPERLTGSPQRIKQILFNLVGNAVKFTRRGAVRIALSPAEEPGLYEITVTDTGPGIPPERRADVFDPFTQVKTREVHKGTGLGLAIVRRLTELMGGEVVLREPVQHPDTGAEFAVCLPLGSAEPGEASLEEAADDLPEKLHVLVAEDDPVSMVYLRTCLDDFGYTFTCVTNGEAALEALAREDFDLALLDVRMPRMDGVEVIREVRKGEMSFANHLIPAVALTAFAMQGDRERFLEEGMSGYLAKPYEIDQLRAEIARVVPG